MVLGIVSFILCGPVRNLCSRVLQRSDFLKVVFQFKLEKTFLYVTPEIVKNVMTYFDCPDEEVWSKIKFCLWLC